MSKHLILVSHGHFCEALKASTEMIMGPQETIHAVPLLPSEGPDDFCTKLEAVVSELDEYAIFADLAGGTPCNVAAKLLLSGYSFDLYAGMNMPMIISYINEQLVGIEGDVVVDAQNGICYVNELISSVDDENE